MNTYEIKNNFNQASEKYDQQRKYFIPCFDDYYGTTVSFLASIKIDFKSVLDLGAGTGLLTKYLYEKFPTADYYLTDISGQMLDVARERFKGLNNFHFTVSDYSEKLPERKFDLIASALSIHHLENTTKALLYKNIFNSLNENGFFINLDQFNAETKEINDHYNSWWYDYIKRSGIPDKDRDSWLKRRELDKENTIEETKILLKDAGFKTVECIYSFMKFGVVIAIK